ncbi:MAG: LemA family protein [Bianqueaceae bacterium]
MKHLQNRKIAWALAALMMVASIFGLGGMKLGSARQKVVTAFFTGRDGFSPYDDLINRREYAYNLLHIAEDASLQDTSSYTAAHAAWQQLDSAKTPEDYYEANIALQTAIDALYSELSSLESLDEKAEVMAAKQYSDFCGRMSNLQYDDYYNELAMKYNQSCKGFPAGLIASITGNGPLPTFREEESK